MMCGLGGDKLQGVSLPDDDLGLLVSAFSLLEHVGLGLRTAEIDAHTLRIVEKHSECFLRLYSLVCHDEDKRHRSEGDESKKDASPEKIFLDMRIEELKAFEKEREAVRCFVQMCTDVKAGESKKYSFLGLGQTSNFSLHELNSYLGLTKLSQLLS